MTTTTTRTDLPIRSIISGGQTGGDAGGLAAGVLLGLKTGGWVPKGWRTENGPAPWLADLGLCEHSSYAYPPRTRTNVMVSHGTLWFGNRFSPGGKLTLRTAREKHKPVFLLEWKSGAPLPGEREHERLRRWLVDHRIEILNVAGNRESSQPGITNATCSFLVSALQA